MTSDCYFHDANYHFYGGNTLGGGGDSGGSTAESKSVYYALAIINFIGAVWLTLVTYLWPLDSAGAT